MEKSYITRRIDELGRFVIPKEIRRNLKIKENDHLEINVVDNKIILNKYENVTKDKIISIIIKSIKKILKKSVLFTSRNYIVESVLINKDIPINKILNDEIVNIIDNRKKDVLCKKNLLVGNNNVMQYYISPLIINGDVYGSIILFSEEEISKNDILIIDFVSVILENYLE